MTTSDISVPEAIREQLGSGERLLWSGAPRQGLVLRAADALFIPFSLIWAGFAVFWEVNVMAQGAPLFFTLFGIPLLVVAAYITIGRFFVDAHIRARTFYAVTAERVLIVSGVFSRSVKSLSIPTIPDLTLREGRGPFGTVSFGGSALFGNLFPGFGGMPGADQFIGPQFELIEQPRTVYDLIRQLQRDARPLAA